MMTVNNGRCLRFDEIFEQLCVLFLQYHQQIKLTEIQEEEKGEGGGTLRQQFSILAPAY